MIEGRSGEIFFARLIGTAPDEIAAHMSDPRLAEHMPLLTHPWDKKTVAAFVAAKEECWRRDGLGHWAILCDGIMSAGAAFKKKARDRTMGWC